MHLKGIVMESRPLNSILPHTVDDDKMEIDAIETSIVSNQEGHDLVMVSEVNVDVSVKSIPQVANQEDSEFDMVTVMREGLVSDETKNTNMHDDNHGEFTNEAFDFMSEEDTEEEARRFEMARPFNMHLLQQSISKGSEAFKHLKGKEVVLVVGKTGSGISTLIRCIAGKRIHGTHHHLTSSAGEVMNKTVFDAEDSLEGFDIGHGKVSETKHIHYLKQKLSTEDRHGKTFFFLDTPGFQDTDGHEIDIATSVVLSQVAKIAHRLRFVILINFVSLIEDRGGAVKGILKLVRTFVDDFEASKLSFMFLFTHTNESARINPKDSLEVAREVVRKEIVLTMQGTKDSELWHVFNLMEKSLKKKFPFVDIFHPILSDVQVLKTTIKRLKAVPGDHMAAHCGLTPSSKLKLTGELHKLDQEVRSNLESESPDLDRCRELLHTFRELKAIIPVHEVQFMAANVSDIFCGFISYQRKIIFEQFEIGISCEHEFGQANVTTICRAIIYLTALNDDFPVEVDMRTINHELVTRLDTYCSKVKFECDKDLSSIHHHLKRLRTWSDGFPELTHYYEVCAKQVSDSFKAYFVDNLCGCQKLNRRI